MLQIRVPFFSFYGKPLWINLKRGSYGSDSGRGSAKGSDSGIGGSSGSSSYSSSSSNACNNNQSNWSTFKLTIATVIVYVMFFD